MPYLEMDGIWKRFGGVLALQGASLSCSRGEVHALLGANGSGKSTLGKVLTGVVEPDAGEVRLEGTVVAATSPRAVHRLGIAAVYQELSLVPQLPVAENILLQSEPTGRLGFVDRKQLLARARELASAFEPALGHPLPLEVPAGELRPDEQQVVEIVKALARRPQVLLLDEATASLHRGEVEALFAIVRRLRDEGRLVIFISHRMEEVFELCDRATVLRNGQTVGTVDLSASSERQIVGMMVGEGWGGSGRRRGRPRDDRPVVLRLNDATTRRLRGVSFHVREGEVVGLGGLHGQGQSDVLAVIYGAERLERGTLELNGVPVRPRGPGAAIRQGLAFVPGNRARQGLFLGRPILENLTLASLYRRSRAGILSAAKERAAAQRIVQDLQVKVGSLSDPARTLSGGNQQKLVVGKGLLGEPRLILMDDPTKGVDVQAKEEIYEIIDRLTRQGVAVLLNSSEDRELVDLCDRVLVLYEGRVIETLEGDALTEERLVAASLRVAETA